MKKNSGIEIKGYCGYCKGEIQHGDAYTTGTDGKLYHPSCYTQMGTYVDEFGDTSDGE